MKVGVSIILCCYNSKDKLSQTLEHLSLQNIEGIQCELILVDNASKDGTNSEARSLWNSFGSPFALKIVIENKPGLSFARKRGVIESSYDIVIFCDDDNWLVNSYVKRSYDFLINNTRIGALGGRGIANSEKPFPIWFETFQTSYACGCQLIESGDATERGYLWGAGLVFRKDLLLSFFEAGYSSLLSDRTGAELSSGGDSEICNWFVINGFKLWYLEDLVYYHFIPEERMEINYLLRLHKGFDESAYYLDKYRAVINWIKTGKMSMVSFFVKSFIYFFIRKDKSLAILLELNNRLSFVTFDAEIKSIMVSRNRFLSK